MDIREELTIHLEDINAQLKALKDKYGVWADYNVYATQNKNGEYIMVPLLVAKAQVLQGLASLPPDPMAHHMDVNLSEQYGVRA